MRSSNGHTTAPAPDVSVLMTVYNGATYLREAIASVFAQQTSAHWELLIVDDGSTDGSAAILRHVAASHPGQIRLLYHPGATNRGISASRNLALRHARGPLVAFLDCDDVLLPNHLETQIAVLHRHSHVAMVYASAERWVHHHLPFDGITAEQAWWGSNYIPPLVPPGHRPGLLYPGTLLRWMLADESHAPCMCTVLVRTDAAREVGGFDNRFEGLFDDQVFHARLSTRFPVYANDRCLARYRQHAASCCATASAAPPLRRTQQARFAQWLRQHLPAWAVENLTMEHAPSPEPSLF